MLEVALMLAAAQELEMPARLIPAMASASHALLRVEQCTGTPSVAEEEFARRDLRYFQLHAAVSAIWGRGPERDLVEAPDLRPRCTEKSRASDKERFDVAIADAEQILKQAIVPMRHGVWLGALQLCRATIVRAETATNSVDDPVLRVWLSDDMRARFADLTETIVLARRDAGKIALRVNGRIVAALGIYERIEDGMLDLPMPAARLSESSLLKRLVTDPC